MKLLYIYSSNKSFTILGDIGQYLLPQRGIDNWGEVLKIFSKENPRKLNIRISYRSTYEITQYANKILKQIDVKIGNPIPYRRHDEKPSRFRSKSYIVMVSKIVDSIKYLSSKRIQTIAILCKNQGEATKMQKQLSNAGIENNYLIDENDTKRITIEVLSIYAAKGWSMML